MENAQIMELIEMLNNMVSDAWGVPLGNDKCIVEREKFLNILNALRARVPVEVTEAKHLVAGRDEFVNNAKREAEAIRRHAEERARILVDEQEIVRVAKETAAELVDTAEYKSNETRRVAQEYLDDILRRAEESVSSALSEITKTRTGFMDASVAMKANVKTEIDTISELELLD